MRPLALLEVPHELAAEGTELGQLFIHGGDTDAEALGDASALRRGPRLSEGEELSNVFQGEPERLGAADEPEAAFILLAVDAIAGGRTSGARQKPLAFIEAHRVRGNPAPLRQLANPEPFHHASHSHHRPWSQLQGQAIFCNGTW